MIQLEVGLQVLWSNPCPQRRPSSSLDWLAQGHAPLSFEHIQFIGLPVLDYYQGENSFPILQCLMLQCACPCALCSGACPHLLHTLHYGEKALRKIPQTALLNKHISLTQLIHVSQGMLKCPSHTDLSKLDAGNSEDALAQVSAWVLAQALPTCALAGLSAPQPLYLLLPGLADPSLFRYVNSPVIMFPEPNSAMAAVPVWGMLSPQCKPHRYFYLDKKCFN